MPEAEVVLVWKELKWLAGQMWKTDLEDEQKARGKWLIFFSLCLCCLLMLTNFQWPLEGVLHNVQTAQTYTKDCILRLKTKYKKKIFFSQFNSQRTQKSISNVSSKTLKTIMLDRSQTLDCFNVLMSANKGGFQNRCLGCLWKVSRIKVLGWPQNCWARVAKAVEEAEKEISWCLMSKLKHCHNQNIFLSWSF